MKHLLIIVLTVLAAGLIVLYFARSDNQPIDASFATSATLKFRSYPEYDNVIDVKISDNDDLRALKEILRGDSYLDSPYSQACGYDVNMSITLTDGLKSRTFCPACDTCPTIRIKGTDRYFDISEQQRERLDRILAKYGMTF